MIQYFVAAFDASFCLCNKNIGELKKKTKTWNLNLFIFNRRKAVILCLMNMMSLASMTV